MLCSAKGTMSGYIATAHFKNTLFMQHVATWQLLSAKACCLQACQADAALVLSWNCLQ